MIEIATNKPGWKMETDYIDLLILAPLDEEADAIFTAFPLVETSRVGDVLLSSVKAEESLAVKVLQLPHWGNQEAYDALKATLLPNRRVGLVACVGIAGSLTSDLKLGDVCYTGTVFDVHEHQKVVDLPKGKGPSFSFSPEVYRTPREVEISFSFLRTHRALREKVYQPWQADCSRKLSDLKETNKSIRIDDERFRDAPIAENGKVACGGAVSSSKSYNASILKIDRKILAIETESGGVFKAAAELDIPAITIRGISDFADSKKRQLEEGLKNAGRIFAANNAATFLKVQLKNPFLQTYLSQRRENAVGGKTDDLFHAIPDGLDLRATLTGILDIVESQLRELSPEYKLQPKGYVLPSPRISPLDSETATEDSPYVEMCDALSEAKAIVVDVPWSYPDQSLPWVLAENLSTNVIHDKQVIPLIINGGAIAPPKAGLAAQSGTVDLGKLYSEDNAQIVFIIHSFDINSRTRINFLVSELEKYPNARCMIVTKGQGTLLLENDLIQRLVAKCYRISNVPFLAISIFIQKNFELPPSEAEVIAYRLHETFQKFDLLTHPTYFAGIPKEMLSALLQANRRAELIQLAVDGFLAFVVTGDAADISLGLNTRKRFLSSLAIEIEVNKRSFTRTDLISFAEEFADRHDFEIDPLRFITAFFDHSILMLEDDVVGFTLPFIKHFLLAYALSKDEALAKRHFALDSDDFDFETFELYCEIGAADSIVELVLKRLREDIDALKIENRPPGVMLGDELRPALLKKFERIADIRVGIQRSIKRLQERSDDGEEKQRLLDVGSKTIGKANKERRASRADEKKDGIQAKVERAERGWRIGCVMLGAAAEQLLGPKKQELASDILRLGSMIVDIQTREHAKVNFAEIKSEIMASPDVEKLIANSKDVADEVEMRTLIENFLDLIEFAILGQPFISTLRYIVDQSGHRILSTSVEKAGPDELQEEIMQAAWLADLNGRKGRVKLNEVIKRTPPSPFFRILLASHFINRVYWTKWEMKDREAMLDAAQDTIQSLGLRVPRDKIMRIIGRESSDESDEEE